MIEALGIDSWGSGLRLWVFRLLRRLFAARILALKCALVRLLGFGVFFDYILHGSN